MAEFELVLSLLLCGVGLALLAPKLRVPWPALLALAGTMLAFVPELPTVALDPRLAMALFVAPVLLDAAYDASPRELRQNWGPITRLVLVAVGLTVLAVAVVARLLRPSMPWAAAIALGAIVAPPDAAAATAVLRQVRLPHRLMVILEGESLLNDVSALLIFRAAIGAAVGGVTIWSAPLLVATLAGGALLGFVLARLYMVATSHTEGGPANIVLQFLGTFGAWLLADALSLSAVLTVIAYAFTLAQRTHGRMKARQRRSSFAVWDVAVFVLNVLAFILIGLQFRAILTRLNGSVWHYVTFGSAILATTILARIAWVMTYNTVIRWWYRTFASHGKRPFLVPTVKTGLLVSWCGMRGIVTLAAALGLPEQFPERDLIVFAAFSVVLGTLVLQGMTLRPLLSRLMLPRDDSVEQQMRYAKLEAVRAALSSLAKQPGDRTSELLVRDYEARLKDGSDTDATKIALLRRRAMAAERTRITDLWREGSIGDDAFHRIEEELDWAEAEPDDGHLEKPPASRL